MLQVVATATIAAYVGLGGLGRFLIDGQASATTRRWPPGRVLVGAARAAGRPGRSPASSAGRRLARRCTGRRWRRYVDPSGGARGPKTPRARSVIPARRQPTDDRETPHDRARRSPAPARYSALPLTACGGGSGSNPLSGRRQLRRADRHDRRRLGQLPGERAAGRDLRRGAQGQGRQGRARKLNIGSRETYIPASRTARSTSSPSTPACSLQYFDKDATAVTHRRRLRGAARRRCRASLTVLDKSAAEDKDAVVVTKETADKYKLKSIADLQPVAKDADLRRPAGVEDPRRPACPASRRSTASTSRTFKSARRRRPADRSTR